jgi:hypothetical protein
MTRHGITTKPARDIPPEATLPCASITMTEADQAIRRHMLIRLRSARTHRNGLVATDAARKMRFDLSSGMGPKSKSP